MAKVIFIDANETRTEVDIEDGENVMNLALNNMVDGILGECGGAMACATCHCYVDDEYADLFSEKDPMEEAMLDLAVDRNEKSRLGCQLELSADMDRDIVIRLPEEQA